MLVFVRYSSQFAMNRVTMNISLAGVLLFLLWTFCIIAVASEHGSTGSTSKLSKPEAQKVAINTLERSSMPMDKIGITSNQIDSREKPRQFLQKRKALRPKAGDRRSYVSQFNFKDAEEETFDEFEVREYARNKRFYPIEPGCIKGYVCCQNPYCRQFCSLCRGQATNQYTQPGRFECEDLNNNTICDYEEEDEEDEAEKMLAEELERKKKEEMEKMLAEELERKKKEEEEKEKMLAEELERKKKEEEEKEKMLAEELERQKEKEKMEAEEQERKKMEAEEQERKNRTQTARGQLEFTHHIYEEYQPQLQAETKAPIILQTIPQYSISNYYSLSKHQHPTSLAVSPFSHHSHSHSSSPSPSSPLPQPPQPPSSHPHHHHHFSHSHHSFDPLNPAVTANHFSGHHTSFGRDGLRPPFNPTLFYEDIHPTSGFGATSGTGPSAPPPMTHIANGKHHFRQHRYPTHLFDNTEETPPLYVSSSAGTRPLPDPFTFNPSHHNSLPHSQTIIYQDRPRENNPIPNPPQPLLKYHLIRQSYPATGESKDYFAEIPAFLPGPPYLPKALPSRKAPVIQRPHRKRNRKGKLMALKGKKLQGKNKKPKKKATGIGSLVRNLLG